MKSSLKLWIFILIQTIASSWAMAEGLPTPQQVQKAVDEVRQALDAFEEKVSETNLDRLDTKVEVFQKIIEVAAKSVDHEAGGAVTRQANNTIRSIINFSIDIYQAMDAIRNQKENELEKTKLEQKFEDIWVNKLEYPMLQMGFMIARHKVDEKDVDGKVSKVDLIKRTFLEIGRTFGDLLRGGQNSVTGEVYYEPVQAYRREALSRYVEEKLLPQVGPRIAEYNRRFDGNSEYNRENHEERLGGLMLWLSDRLVNIRVERDSAQRYARFSLLAMGAVPVAFPVLNLVESSYTAQAETAGVIFGSFALMYLYKGLTSSMKSTRAWFEFNRKVRSEMRQGLVESTEKFLESSFPKEYHPAQVPGWIKREMQLRNALSQLMASPTRYLKAQWSKIRGSGDLRMCSILFR